jgi:hypothetical protein
MRFGWHDVVLQGRQRGLLHRDGHVRKKRWYLRSNNGVECYMLHLEALSCNYLLIWRHVLVVMLGTRGGDGRWCRTGTMVRRRGCRVVETRFWEALAHTGTGCSSVRTLSLRELVETFCCCCGLVTIGRKRVPRLHAVQASKNAE